MRDIQWSWCWFFFSLCIKTPPKKSKFRGSWSVCRSGSGGAASGRFGLLMRDIQWSLLRPPCRASFFPPRISHHPFILFSPCTKPSFCSRKVTFLWSWFFGTHSRRVGLFAWPAGRYSVAAAHWVLPAHALKPPIWPAKCTKSTLLHTALHNYHLAQYLMIGGIAMQICGKKMWRLPGSWHILLYLGKKTAPSTL